jgi:virulence-associated protein VapD
MAIALMFALAFDLDTFKAEQLHPKGNSSSAYTEIRHTLAPFGFNRIQGSTYAADHEDHARLFLALTALRALPWFGGSLRNLRVFRMEAGTDFTDVMKTGDPI